MPPSWRRRATGSPPISTRRCWRRTATAALRSCASCSGARSTRRICSGAPCAVAAPEPDRLYKNQVRHDPADLDAARRLAEPDGKIRLGVFYPNDTLPVYEETRAVPARSHAEKLALLNTELDRHAV